MPSIISIPCILIIWSIINKSSILNIIGSCIILSNPNITKYLKVYPDSQVCHVSPTTWCLKILYTLWFVPISQLKAHFLQSFWTFPMCQTHAVYNKLQTCLKNHSLKSSQVHIACFNNAIITGNSGDSGLGGHPRSKLPLVMTALLPVLSESTSSWLLADYT